LTLVLSFLTLVVTGCGKSQSSACERFLADYEEFSKSYVDYMRAFSKNPSDLTLLARGAELAAKADKMDRQANAFTSDANQCADSPGALERITKVQQKMLQDMSNIMSD
jgi:hypothetical protein